MPLELIFVIALISIGIVFLLIELFLLPGTTIAGIAGAVFMIAGIIYAFVSLGSVAGNITIAVSVLIFGGLFVWFVKSKALRTIGLKSSIEETVDNSFLKKVSVGDRGVAVSRLNPIGKVVIDDVEMEGKSFDNEFIEEEAEIEVVKVDSVNVMVKRLESSTLSFDESTTPLTPAQELPSEAPAPLSARLRSGNAQQLQG
jgi:membrane-bound ClpP family serine protease